MKGDELRGKVMKGNEDEMRRKTRLNTLHSLEIYEERGGEEKNGRWGS